MHRRCGVGANHGIAMQPVSCGMHANGRACGELRCVLPKQAAGAIAALAMQHARDERYMSPYIVEAARQGFDLGFWEKVTAASFEDGQLKLGTLRVRGSLASSAGALLHAASLGPEPLACCVCGAEVLRESSMVCACRGASLMMSAALWLWSWRRTLQRRQHRAHLQQRRRRRRP